MSPPRQTLTRILLLTLLWTTIITLTSHASHTLRSFSDGSRNLLNFRVYPTLPLACLHSWRENSTPWQNPFTKSYHTLPATIQTAYTLSLSLAAATSAILLLTSYNRCAKTAALTTILAAFASIPFTLLYMLLPQTKPDLSDNPVILWSYFLEQFISYLVTIILTGLELRSMKTFHQIKTANTTTKTGHTP